MCWISIVAMDGYQHYVNLKRVAVVRRREQKVNRTAIGAHGQWVEEEVKVPEAILHVAEGNGSITVISCIGQQARIVLGAVESLVAKGPAKGMLPPVFSDERSPSFRPRPLPPEGEDRDLDRHLDMTG